MSNQSPDDHAVTKAFAPQEIEGQNAVTVARAEGETPTARDAAPPPATVPGYELMRELGRGGMGVVYLAKQDGLNRQVALKMVLSGAHASVTEKGRFLAEAEAVAAVRHPGVVQVFDFGTHDGRPYFALEFLPGGSLTAKLNGTPLRAKEAAKLVEAIARAVQAAHEVGVIHRDLKPGNILFDSDGVAKVTDFGLARKSDTNSGLTATGAILGTPSYMAPEQAEGRKDVGPAADIYAVGTILYECLTGRPPFRATSPLETIHQVLKDEPVPPSRFHPKLPKDLETVCLKCLHKDPRRRYESAGALADDLNRFLSGEPIVARPVSLIEKYWRSVRRRPALNALILLTCISIGVAIGVLTGSNKSLRRKQEQLEKETTAARTAEVEAKTQRELAQSRLEKAIEAVDKMVTRVNSERWAIRAELQDERREVLEDAVAFFNGFTGVDSTDPQVRREMAKAHTRLSGAYLMLGDLTKAHASNREAVRLYDGLMVEFPNEPEHAAAASEAYSLTGGANALTGQYDVALRAYTRAVELADSARARVPNNPLYQLRAVESRSSLGYFHLQMDRRKGEALVGPMLDLARELGGGPDAKYEHRVALGFALTVGAAYDQSSTTLPGPQRLTAASAKYDEAAKVLDSTKGQSAPSARARDQFAQTRAMVTVQRALIATFRATTPEQRRDAAKQMQAGLQLFDDLLRLNPKAFPYLVQKYTVLRALGDVYRNLADPDTANKFSMSADQLIDQMIRDNPHVEWLRLMDAIRQTHMLIERVRNDNTFSFETDADQLLAAALPRNRWDAVYNVACIYSVASEKRSEQTEKYAAKAVTLLNDLTKTDYFHVPARIKHLDKDTDLDPLRKRDDFKAFHQEVKRTSTADTNSR